MAERLGREIFSGLRWGRGGVPAQGASGACRGGFAAGGEGYGFGAEDRASVVQHGLGEFCQVFCGGEKSSVGGYSTEDAGVFVLDFALDWFFSESSIVLGGRNGCTDFQGGIECGVGH